MFDLLIFDFVTNWKQIGYKFRNPVGIPIKFSQAPLIL